MACWRSNFGVELLYRARRERTSSIQPPFLSSSRRATGSPLPPPGTGSFATADAVRISRPTLRTPAARLSSDDADGVRPIFNRSLRADLALLRTLCGLLRASTIHGSAVAVSWTCAWLVVTVARRGRSPEQVDRWARPRVSRFEHADIAEIAAAKEVRTQARSASPGNNVQVLEHVDGVLGLRGRRVNPAAPTSMSPDRWLSRSRRTLRRHMTP